MIIYGLKNCDTCRKARKALPDAQFRDVRDDGIAEDVLLAAYAALGAQLLNTRSTTWRGLSEEERQGDPVSLIQAQPALMKRPLIAVDNQFLLGWNSSVEQAAKATL